MPIPKLVAIPCRGSFEPKRASIKRARSLSPAPSVVHALLLPQNHISQIFFVTLRALPPTMLTKAPIRSVLFTVLPTFLPLPSFFRSRTPSHLLSPNRCALKHTLHPRNRSPRAATAIRAKKHQHSKERPSQKAAPPCITDEVLTSLPTAQSLLAYVKLKSTQSAVRKIFLAVHQAELGPYPPPATVDPTANSEAIPTCSPENREDQGNAWSAAGIRPTNAVYNSAIRLLTRLERPDLAISLFRTRTCARAARPTDIWADPALCAAVVRSALRVGAGEAGRKYGAEQRANDLRFLVCDLRAECDAFLESNNDGELVSDSSGEGGGFSSGGVSDDNDWAPDMEATPPSGNDATATAITTAAMSPTSLHVLLARKFCGALVAVLNAQLATVTGKGVSPNADDVTLARSLVERVCALARAYGTATQVDVVDWNTAIRLLGKARALDAVFNMLDAMSAAGVERNDETFEFLANAAVRQVHFVKGAVSMDTLPEPLGAEVAFVGRSNVGKSSLVNMICNRKALAKVSRRPGKTQQFNYFLVNESDGDSQFYIVDLPGVGYAKVPKQLQVEWLRFMRQYLRYRSSLGVVFHLVDGRHGALGDDEMLMEEMGRIRGSCHYVVVLTKMDKSTIRKKKTQDIIRATREALLKHGCAQDVAIVLTSAVSKMGRDEMWRHLQTGLKLLQVPAGKG